MEPPRIIRKQATEDQDSSDADEDIPEEDEEQDEEEDSTDSRGRRVQQYEEKEESEDEISLDDLDVNPEPARGLNIPTMGRGMSRSMSSASNVKSQAVREKEPDMIVTIIREWTFPISRGKRRREISATCKKWSTGILSSEKRKKSS